MTVASEPDRCPPSEVLAAFVEGRLSRDRAKVMEHLAECAECRFVVESATEAQTEVAVAPSENSEVVTPFVRTVEAEAEKTTRRATRLHLWLSAAAAVAVVFAIGSYTYTTQMTRQMRKRNAAVSELVNALASGHRLVEPRLTSMSVYAPPKPVYRSGNPEEVTSEELIIGGKAASVIDMTKDDHSPEATYARGVASLFIGEKQNAVDDLREVATNHVTDAKAWSDLSAALYVAGKFNEAHAAADQALVLNPELNEARFNRALSSSRLDEKASIAEWNDYLKHDPTSPWSKEAREKLELLTPEK